MSIYRLLFVMLTFGIASTQSVSEAFSQSSGKPILGADRSDIYLPLLNDKKVGVVVNQTSVLSNGIHLVDFLSNNSIEVIKVFAPEHGFRGKASAGESIQDGRDTKTGSWVISLHGKTRKPSKEMLSGLDYVLFDIQDVGARFYTYISTMHLVMEACAENNIPFMVLDRPNPNGHYIDGPVLEPDQKSFLGMHPIPVVHGLTVGELAQMINGEGWLSGNMKADLTIVKLKGWNHDTPYDLPIKPSPNLPNATAVTLYPSLCFFEQTIMSIGRGTEFPFQVIGHPEYTGDFSFTPKSMEGALHPKLENKNCKGLLLTKSPRMNSIDLKYLIDTHDFFKQRNQDFFLSSLSKLAGTTKFQKQIEMGMSAEAIRKSWQSDLDTYRKMRIRHLIYP